MVTLTLGYFFTILCIVFLVIVAYNYYTSGNIFNININLIDLAFIIFLIIMFLLTSLSPEEKNPLKCEKCKEGKLSYVDTINYKDGTTFYRYHCDNCDRLFRTEEWRGK